MIILKTLKKYNVSPSSVPWAVEDVGLLGIGMQRKLLKELFGEFDYELPNKNYLLTMTLKFIVNDVVREQRTAPFTSIKPYKKAVNNAKRMGKESSYAKYILSNQKAKRKKRKVHKSTSANSSGAAV